MLGETTAGLIRSQSRAPAPERFLEAGFAVVPSLLDAELLERTAELAQRIVAARSDAVYEDRHRSIGSLFDVLPEPEMVDLLAHPALLRCLRELGCADPRFEHGIVFRKPPASPRTFWHQDGTAWNHSRKPPASPRTFWHQDGTAWNHSSGYRAAPLEVIAILYLSDTAAANGCLRVIPGSHRRRHRLHDALAGSHTPDLRCMRDPRDAAFQIDPDEICVGVRAGDLVVLDTRLLHAAHANTAQQPRTAVSLWYRPGSQLGA